jgi:PAS domain S-box-containing protein
LRARTFPQWPNRFAELASGLVILGGLSVLLGWALDIAVVQSVLPGWTQMAPLTALSFILAGVALWLVSPSRLDSAGKPAGDQIEPAHRWLSHGCAAIVAFVGALRLGAYAMKWNFPGDMLLFREASGDSVAIAMPPATAAGFLLVGSALLFARSSRFIGPFQLLSLLTALIAWLGFNHYVFGGEMPYAQMALHTALLLLVLSAGTLCARTDGGLMALLSSDSLGGLIGRRLVPAAILVPIVLRWLRMEGHLAGWYESHAGWSFFALAITVVFGALIWAAASLLHRVDAQRKDAEAAVRSNQQLLQAIADGSLAVIYAKDLEGHYLLINRRFEELFHLRREEMAGRTAYDLFPKDRADALSLVDRKVLASGTALETEEVVPHDDGPHTYLSIKYPMRDGTGKVYGVCGISTDITERKRAEEALRRSEEGTRAIIDAALDAIIAMDHEGRIVEFNPAAERIFGHRSADVMGRALAEVIIPPALREQHRRGLAYYCATGEAPVLGKRIEVQGARADGTEFPLEVSITRMPGTGPPKFTGFLRDIAERRQLEEQLRQSQRMEAIGRLAGGVAHDFNNLLTVINGYCDMLLEDVLPDSLMSANLNEVKNAGEQAANLTRQLLAFSRKQLLQPKILNVNAIIENNARILRRLIREDTEILTLLEPELGLVQADAGQLEQVLMNLAVNAQDAMPQGGRLTIETKNIVLDETYVSQHTSARAGSYVMIAVSDTGHGMDAATRSRIFEPFFTTKELGRGTGLGLSIVYGIVKQSEGDIWVYSEPGKGTTFKIYLPRSEAAAAIPAETYPVTETAANSETVLVVEDDPIVRKMVCRVLQNAGYQVLSAHHGGDGLRIYQECGDHIGLILTDLVMPEISGPALVEKIKSRNPEVKVVYMSGYADKAAVGYGYLDPAVPFVQKPFNSADLLRKVREALDLHVD